MLKSIIQTEKECFFCKTINNLERHHCFGAYNRNNSEKYGLTVWLCHNCHNEAPWGVHFNKQRRAYLQELAQKEFEKKYPELNFIEIFGRNYIGVI